VLALSCIPMAGSKLRHRDESSSFGRAQRTIPVVQRPERQPYLDQLRHMPGLLPECFGACSQVSEPALFKCVRKTHLRNDTGSETSLSKDWNTRCTSQCVFRLNKELGERRTRLTFDGELFMECIESLERCCEEALKNGKPVDLILRDVTGVDEAGQALLRRLAARGVCLFANGLYVSYLLDNIRTNASDGRGCKQKF
jgi:hypothetical protein